MCSAQWDIVESTQWLNKIPENGLDGGCPGVSNGPHSDETKLKMSIAKKGITQSEDHKLKLSIVRKGRKNSDKTKLQMSVSHTGVKKGPQAVVVCHTVINMGALLICIGIISIIVK